MLRTTSYQFYQMLQKFLNDLCIPGCQIQFGTEKSVLLAAENPSEEDVRKLLSSWQSNNLYFLGGVSTAPRMKTFRAADSDIHKKNYFYIDLDVRKTHPELTDNQIQFDVWINMAKPCLEQLGAPYSNWKYVVFTGNGLHIYYFGETIEIQDAQVWKNGVNLFLDAVEKSLNEKFDRACSNPARIARLPFSNNCKQTPHKEVLIIDEQDKKISMANILKTGAEVVKAVVQPTTEFSENQDTYTEIQKIPVGKVLTMITGWTMSSDGHFYSSNSDRKGCFVSKDGNYIINGGTPHLPSGTTGFRTFELVKYMKRYDNTQTFFWFKQNFPHLKELGDDGLPEYSISNAFKELRTMEVRQLNIGNHWDDWRLLLRGKVTRIGAMPGTGKSKLGYYLTHCLLKKEYKGIFFSTEVQASDVLAHMLQITMKKPYLDILEHRVDVPPELENEFKRLKVYDVRHTGNMLSNMEKIIKKENDKAEAEDGRALDFICIDFSQQVTPKSGRIKDIFSWAWEWGNECQEIAQKYGVCVIDVCQLSIKGNKDEDEKYGSVPYEGGNKLHQTADISSMINRDRSLSQDNVVTWDVRKSKSMGRRFKMDMEYDWTSGVFSLTGATDSRVLAGETGFINYK